MLNADVCFAIFISQTLERNVQWREFY